jgi:enoyl-CoA hydratase/carnithine racemase
VTFDNPPINVADLHLVEDLLEFLVSIQPASSNTAPPKVVIFDSADPKPFILQVDFHGLLSFPNEPVASPFVAGFQLADLLRNTTSTGFIAEVNGIASSIGDEIALQCEFRFAGPNALVSQIEISLGLFASGGGLEALPRLIGRGRGMQYLLAGDGVDGKRAAEIGWFNEYLSKSQELRQAMDKIAKRIALNPAPAIATNKWPLLYLLSAISKYEADNTEFVKLLADPVVKINLRRALELSQNQSRNAWELGLPVTLVQILE